MPTVSVNKLHQVLNGPSIWLAGDPEDLKQWMLSGIAGIVTNTVVLNEMTKKYGQITEVVKRYLDITDKKVAVEIDGHSTQELLDVGEIRPDLISILDSNHRNLLTRRRDPTDVIRCIRDLNLIRCFFFREPMDGVEFVHGGLMGLSIPLLRQRTLSNKNHHP